MNDSAAHLAALLSGVVGYRLEWRPGDYMYYTPEDFAKEINKESARIWTLHLVRQPGCPNEPAVYKGWCWSVKENHLFTPDFTPIYLGPKIHEPK